MSIYALAEISPSLPAEFNFIAPNASVIGNVILAEDVGIWFGTVIRGDNEPITVGKRSNIQENCVLHTDPGFPVIIGEGCTIGHNATVHGCKIGDNSLIGMGATVLNGAVIGNNCLVGAGALIVEGKNIPDNSLVVGAPGKVVRDIDDKGVAMLRESANIYVANARRFAKELKKIT